MSMEVKRVYYNDDDILILGHLIRRRFRKPVFYPFDMRSGFGNEIVNNENLILGYNTKAYRKFYKDISEGNTDCVD